MSENHDPSLTELKELAEKIKELRAQELSEYDFFWNNAVAIFVIAKDGYFINVNPAFTKATGWTKEDLRTMKWETLLHPDDLKDSLELAERRKTIGPTAKKDYFVNRWKKKNGMWATLRWQASIFIEGKYAAVALHEGDHDDA